MENKELAELSELRLVKNRESRIEYYAVRIEKTWHKALESIFAVGDLLIEAQAELKPKEYSSLLRSGKMPFKKRTAEKLIAIAKKKHLRKPYFMKHLPPCWTTLDVLQQLSPAKLRAEIKSESVTAEITRQEAVSLVGRINHNGSAIKGSGAVTPRNNGKTLDNLPALEFTVSSRIDDCKAPLDVHFICEQITALFNNGSGKTKVSVTRRGKNFSARLLKSYELLYSLVEKAREIENLKRVKQDKKRLTPAQQVLSLFGVDPDELGKCDYRDAAFSLMEKIVVAYAKRQGLRIKESELAWFANSQGDEPVLEDTFRDKIEKQAASILSALSAGHRETKILLVDAHIDEDGETEGLAARH
jgi:hypothetical protein